MTYVLLIEGKAILRRSRLVKIIFSVGEGRSTSIGVGRLSSWNDENIF